MKKLLLFAMVLFLAVGNFLVAETNTPVPPWDQGIAIESSQVADQVVGTIDTGQYLEFEQPVLFVSREVYNQSDPELVTQKLNTYVTLRQNYVQKNGRTDINIFLGIG